MRVILALVLAAVSCGGSSATLTGTDRPTRSPAPTASSAPRTTTPPTTATVARTIRYVAIGASDSVGVGARDPVVGSWPARVAALLPSGAVFRNVAVSGSLTEQARSEQLPLALREQPTVVSIWLAVNDLNAQVTAAAHAAALSAIVDALVRETPARIFVGTVPDLRVVPAYAGVDPAALFAQVQAYNAGIAALAVQHPARVVIVDLFTGSAELTSQITLSGDGLHPSDAGYVLIAGRFADSMRANGVPLGR